MHCADGTHPLYDRNEVHDIYREWRKVFNEYDPPAFAVAEAGYLRSINTGMPRPKNSAKCSTSNSPRKTGFATTCTSPSKKASPLRNAPAPPPHG